MNTAIETARRWKTVKMLASESTNKEKIIQTKIEILEEDPDQDLRIIEEIYLEIKKGTEETPEIIINMIEADLEIIIKIIEAADNKETISTNYWDTLLNNTSIKRALANYLQDSYHIIVPTTYEHNQAIERQLIVSKVDNNWDEEYKDEELISYEAYTLEAESNNIEDSEWTIYQQKSKISHKKNQRCRTCEQTDHYFEDC
ncbi:9799_t:CDS:2 [Racocetra persica]|uniref:9799_t:CDS:1 n=1 Tax=Racocetra persica TaxID=160502 RepID=A0ACA9KWT2_9GLOM|nr:9799_t:CDS:2 [Racocetra persica]